MRTQTMPFVIGASLSFGAGVSPVCLNALARIDVPITSAELRRESSMSGIVSDVEAARLDVVMEDLEERVEKMSFACGEDWPDMGELGQLGTLISYYGEPVLMQVAPAKEGTFTPVEFDEVDMEFIEL